MNLPSHVDTELDDQIQTPEDTTFGDMLQQYEKEHRGDRGQSLHGTVIAVNEESVFVDIGRKTEGIISLAKVKEAVGDAGIRPGDHMQVNVLGRTSEGYYDLATLRVERPKDWSALEAAFAGHVVIAGTVAEVIKGGLRVDVGVRAFMPASRSGAKDVAEMEKLVGQEIRCRITKLDTAAEDVVVDRRGVLEEEERGAREAVFQAIQEGMVMRGRVRSLMDFGAFVDIGGVDGLLHVTDMAWTRVAKPADLLTAGQEIEVKVLKVNPATHKISLGMKQLAADPWTLAGAKFNVGDRVKGKVARLTDFGAFVEIEPGVDGLVHVSEMSWAKKVRKPSDLLALGDAVEVVVLGINIADRKISLGLKQALGNPWEEAERKYPVGSIVEGPITSITNFGAFVELGEGVEGMIHVGDITREKRLEHPREMVKAGQVVKAAVAEFDREKRRIRLSMKQLEPTTADQYIVEHQSGETVTGRVVDVKPDRAKIELGEGVFAVCALRTEGAKGSSAGTSSVDLSAMTKMLSARWKSGGLEADSSGAPAPLKPGQLRSFRITALDAEQKRIQIELVS